MYRERERERERIPKLILNVFCIAFISTFSHLYVSYLMV
jgi:hypothetical protein